MKKNCQKLLYIRQQTHLLQSFDKDGDSKFACADQEESCNFMFQSENFQRGQKLHPVTSFKIASPNVENPYFKLSKLDFLENYSIFDQLAEISRRAKRRRIRLKI